MSSYKCIVFWNGFPACGHMLKSLSIQYGSQLKVFATSPSVPFVNLGMFLENDVTYLKNHSELLNYYQDIKKSEVFIHTGWCYGEINQIDKMLKAESAKTEILIMVDNRFKFSIRQIFGAIYFRLFLKNLYDGIIVSGKSAAKLMKFFGVSNNKIASGHYGAPSDLFPRWNKTIKKKQFIFVGSLDKRKGFDLLIKAWEIYKKNGGKWSLKVIGNGPLKQSQFNIPDLDIQNFQQPKEVSEALIQSYALILPSRDDNWGTVIAEAAASGCILISSKLVGAAEDLIDENRNGFIIKPLSYKSICSVLQRIEKITDSELLKMCEVSVKFSENFDSDRMRLAVMKLIKN